MLGIAISLFRPCGLLPDRHGYVRHVHVQKNASMDRSTESDKAKWINVAEMLPQHVEGTNRNEHDQYNACFAPPNGAVVLPSGC
jgi:hypothetical protein